MPAPKNRRLDVGRLSELLRRPGMDTRTWLTYAVVRDVAFDPEHGLFADVTFLPSEIQETVLVATGYAGPEWGVWAPLKVDDMVLVAVPGGDSNDGAVIISRLWTGLEKPPALARGETTQRGMPDPSEHLSVTVEPGQKLQVKTDGGAIEVTALNGAIQITATGSANIELKVSNGKVTLGGDGLTPLLDGVVTARGFDPFSGQTYGNLGNASSVVLARKT